MFVACRHPNGLNLNGVIVKGPALYTPRAGYEVPRDAPQIYGGYAITEVPDDEQRLIDWTHANKSSQIITDGVVVVGSSFPDVQLQIFQGRRDGRFIVPDWAQSIGHVEAS